MKEIIITVTSDIAEELQSKNFEVLSMQEIITDLLEAHEYDKDDKILNSPILIGYQAKLIKVRVDFERLKDHMLTTFVDEKTLRQVVSWNLDYDSCKLYLQVAD